MGGARLATVIVWTDTGVFSRALASLERQRLSRSLFEVIVVMMGPSRGKSQRSDRPRRSTDVLGLALPNATLAEAWNRALSLSTSDICIFLNGTLSASPEFVRDYVIAFYQGARVVAGTISSGRTHSARAWRDRDWRPFGGVVTTSRLARVIEHQHELAWARVGLAAARLSPLFDWSRCVPDNVAFSRSLIRELGGFAPELARLAAVHAAKRAATRGTPSDIRVLELGACAQRSPGNAGAGLDGAVIHEWRSPAVRDEPELWLWFAWRHLRLFDARTFVDLASGCAAAESWALEQYRTWLRRTDRAGAARMIARLNAPGARHRVP